MKIKKRVYTILSLAGITVLVGASVALASGSGRSGGVPGQIDDGAELLSRASITLDQAISAAQAAFDGELGEIDLEMYQGTLVFNVDIGRLDVKVDAADGSVLGKVADDEDDEDGD